MNYRRIFFAFCLTIICSINILAFNTNITFQIDTLEEDAYAIEITHQYKQAMEDMMRDMRFDRLSAQRCDSSSVVPILYDDSIYISRLQKLPYSIAMPYNDMVKKFINLYANRIKQVEYMVGLGEHYYFPIFERALMRYNLPLELKYMPIIESALNPTAVSRAGAGGLWQFMLSTGRLYDLEVNSLVDERYDPVKASDAAARYLRDLYSIYNDWHLVIAAYNCGSGNILKAIRRSGNKTSYWDIYPYLPAETRGYVPIFIAANYIMTNYSRHNICVDVPKFVNMMTDTVRVNRRVHLKQISNVLNIDIEDLRFLNPQYKRDIVPGNIKSYPVVLPIDKISSFENDIDSIVAYDADNLINRVIKVKPAKGKKRKGGSYRYHRIRKGESLSTIAHKYGTTVSKLKRANRLRSNRIRAGRRLKIPR